MGIEPTTSGLLDQRRSHSENQAPSLYIVNINCVFHDRNINGIHSKVKNVRKLEGLKSERNLHPYWLST